jgi:hypothetical protein
LDPPFFDPDVMVELCSYRSNELDVNEMNGMDEVKGVAEVKGVVEVNVVGSSRKD